VLCEVTADETAALTADEFATFFQNKVESVHSSTASTPLYDVPYKTTATLDAWTAVTADEVEKLISSALCKTCPTRPRPHMASQGSARIALTVYSVVVQQIVG